MATSTTLEQLDLDFKADGVIDWAYPGPEK